VSIAIDVMNVIKSLWVGRDRGCYMVEAVRLLYIYLLIISLFPHTP
jgi:hypothetical protein